MIRKKILLLGDFNVGKTSLIRRYVENIFDDRYLTTLGVKVSKKSIAVYGKEMELLIWDIEGATPGKKIPQNYFKGASGAIFVSDVSRSETYEHIGEYIKHFLEINPDASYIIASNKADLLSAEQRSEFKTDDDIFLVSAKENTNVEKLFYAISKRIIA